MLQVPVEEEMKGMFVVGEVVVMEMRVLPSKEVGRGMVSWVDCLVRRGPVGGRVSGVVRRRSGGRMGWLGLIYSNWPSFCEYAPYPGNIFPHLAGKYPTSNISAAVPVPIPAKSIVHTTPLIIL